MRAGQFHDEQPDVEGDMQAGERPPLLAERRVDQRPAEGCDVAHDHRMADQRIGKGGDPARRQAGDLVAVVGPVGPEDYRGPDIEQDAAGDDDQGDEIDRRREIDRRQEDDRDGLHRHGIALEDLEPDRPEGEGQPVEIVVPEAQQIDRERHALIERGAEQDRQDEQGARQRRAVVRHDGADRLRHVIER